MVTSTSSAPVATSVRQVPVPAAARAGSRLARIDYADAFLVELAGPPPASADAWARAVLHDAPRELRLRLVGGWTALGLKLRPTGDLLGWTVRERTPDLLLLGAGSRVGMPAELVFLRRPGGLLFCTFVQQDTALARGLWAATEPVHVPVVRSLLTQAGDRLQG